MIAVIYARKGVARLLCALTLTGCQLYWRKPGASLAAFTPTTTLAWRRRD